MTQISKAGIYRKFSSLVFIYDFAKLKEKENLQISAER